ncbi:hypothetical protein THAOC_23447, partial [Thalassiosira oceanica]
RFLLTTISYFEGVTPWARSYATRFVLAGAEEACWAHNPKVQGSKPWRAIFALS